MKNQHPVDRPVTELLIGLLGAIAASATLLLFLALGCAVLMRALEYDGWRACAGVIVLLGIAFAGVTSVEAVIDMAAHFGRRADTARYRAGS